MGETSSNTEGARPGAQAEPQATAAPDGTRRRNTATAVVAIGAALLMPELLPGIVIGLAAALAPKYFPRFAPYLKRAKEKAAHVAERARVIGHRDDAPAREQHSGNAH